MPSLTSLGGRSPGLTTIEVIKGFDMPRMDLTGDSDCYAVLTLLDGTSRQKIADLERTAPHYNQRNPVVCTAMNGRRL